MSTNLTLTVLIAMVLLAVILMFYIRINAERRYNVSSPDPVCRDLPTPAPAPSPVHKHLDLLGLTVVDKVTGREGIVTSVCFDLYGCIQAAVDPGYKEDGSRHDCSWFDINRLRVLFDKPVMDRPDFLSYGHPQAEGLQGSADKPAPGV